MENRQFRQLLTDRQQGVNSLVCVGLDPLMEKVPQRLVEATGSGSTALFLWMKSVIDMTEPFASMFKFQHAHWEAIPGGLRVLRVLIAYIHEAYPEIPVMIDCKRGDIDRTQERYREAHLNYERADGMNYVGWMGRSTLKALVDSNQMGRGLVGLGRTSNPDAWEIQDAIVDDGQMLWQFMVRNLFRWSAELGVLDNAGVVMGAAHSSPADKEVVFSSHLSGAREIVGSKMWFLIPGIGTQGGFVRETVKTAFMGPGSIAINSSSGIIFADDPADAARELRDQIIAAGGDCS